MPYFLMSSFLASTDPLMSSCFASPDPLMSSFFASPDPLMSSCLLLQTRLGNPALKTAVDSVVSELLAEKLEWHPAVLAAIVDKALSAQAAALAAKAARDLVRRKTLLTSTVLPGKVTGLRSRPLAAAFGSGGVGRGINIQHGRVVRVSLLPWLSPFSPALILARPLLSPPDAPSRQLADCATRDPSEAEIYIVEGDSAAG